MNYSTADLLKFEKEIKEKCLVGDRPVFDTKDFEWAKLLEENHLEILGEFNNFINTFSDDKLLSMHEISVVQRPLTSDAKWKVIPLLFYNEVNTATTLMMPRTTAIINSIPVITTCFFSILHPGKHIPPHRGPYAGVLRCHLPLKVPRNSSNCWIRVANEKCHWELGKVLIFDDTYEHEALNGTDEIRVVLFIDFLRPLPRDLAEKNGDILDFFRHSEFVKDPKSKYEKWEKKYLPSL